MNKKYIAAVDASAVFVGDRQEAQGFVGEGQAAQILRKGDADGPAGRKRGRGGGVRLRAPTVESLRNAPLVTEGLKSRGTQRSSHAGRHASWHAKAKRSDRDALVKPRRDMGDGRCSAADELVVLEVWIRSAPERCASVQKNC